MSACRRGPDVDPRWVMCRRPCIIVGGELIAGMVELRLDDSSGIYAAPLQMKANNGIFIIDDFGRQLMSPRDLLNRWIVPLDRRVDYLTLRYGVKFQIPFEVMVVFATNLDPSRSGRRGVSSPHTEQDLRQLRPARDLRRDLRKSRDPAWACRHNLVVRNCSAVSALPTVEPSCGRASRTTSARSSEPSAATKNARQ